MSKKVLWGIGAGIVGLWLFTLSLPYIALNSSRFRVPDKDAKRVESVLGQLGTYGDLFGSVNALFSALALLGVAYAVMLQKEELRIQQAEVIKADKARADAEISHSKTVAIQALSALASNLTALAASQAAESGGPTFFHDALEQALKERSTEDYLFRLLRMHPRNSCTHFNMLIAIYAIEAMELHVDHDSS